MQLCGFQQQLLSLLGKNSQGALRPIYQNYILNDLTLHGQRALLAELTTEYQPKKNKQKQMLLPVEVIQVPLLHS